MSGAGKGAAAVRLFDAHCHLQDPRVFSVAPQLIRKAQESGVLRFAVNGVSEKDWHLVKQMSEQHPCVIPCFGLHPWYVEERSPNWLSSMKEFFNAVPCAAVGEVGLDKGSHGKEIDFSVQIEVLRQQLAFAKEVGRPVSIHCVRAFGDLLEVLQYLLVSLVDGLKSRYSSAICYPCYLSDGPFPAGLLLHSYLGSAEMVPEFTKHGAYFSFSGYLTTMKPQKAKKMLKMVPIDRILLESDAPDGFPRLGECSFSLVPGDASIPQEQQIQMGDINADTTKLPKETLNHPANVSTVLHYVAKLLEISEEELAEVSYRNATHLFSYPGSKVSAES
ncbi:hypothetical protein Taro_031366 [Colocasia esculenta]|uniref:TatD related DNase n=1 Tax=Colocasia esculenta TaxID=4460 RepID=A0A843W0P7_COLES|nr:hypothetical protein [Colocasia esculenta]